MTAAGTPAAPRARRPRRRPTDPFERARRLHTLGVQATASGRPAVGVRNLKSALALLEAGADAEAGDPGTGLRGRVILSLANAQAELGNVDVALELLDQAEKLLPQAEFGVLSGQRGMLLMKTGRAAEAVPEFDEALARLPPA